MSARDRLEKLADGLRPRSPGPDALDLKRHRPEEFSGKTVSLDDRDYRIGACVRQHDQQGYAHRLINPLSGLCLHVIQIRPEYMRSPEDALATSLRKAELTAEIRARCRAKSQGEVVFFTVRKAHRGSFELHETPWGMMGHESDPPAAEEIQEAAALIGRADHAAAIARLERVLAEHPHHTVALNNLAGCILATGDPVQALAIGTRAVEIEPNSFVYRGNQIWYALNCPARKQASALFDEFEDRFPHLRDFDHAGIHAYLRVGEPARARELLDRASGLRPEEMDDVRAAVELAERVRERYTAIETRKRANAIGDPELLLVLEELFASCPADPYIAANLGCLLRRMGQNRRAAALLFSASGGSLTSGVQCMANAAYCLIAESEWNSAMRMLDATMDLLKSRHDRLEASDVPGLADWISRDDVLESIEPNATDLLDLALARCPDPSLVSPAIREMATLLRGSQSARLN